MVAVGAVLALAGCGASTTKTVTASTTSTVPPSTTASTSESTAAVYFQGAAGGAQQRPATLELTADGTLIVNSVQWTSWGGSAASGTGNAEYHGCNPNCASAPIHTASVSIRLSGVRICSGRSYYSGVTLTMNSGQLLDSTFLQRSWSPC